MLVSSADLLGTAAIAAGEAQRAIEAVLREENIPPRPVDSMHYAEARLVQALAELRAARWGVERRMPQFDDRDLELLIEREALAIHAGRDCIPAPAR